MIQMTLCPNCRTIQKAGITCPICKCPIHMKCMIVHQPQPKPVAKNQKKK